MQRDSKLALLQVTLKSRRQGKFCGKQGMHCCTAHPLEPLVQPRMAVSHWYTGGPTWRGTAQETKADKSSCTKAHRGTAQNLDFIVAIIALEIKQ